MLTEDKVRMRWAAIGSTIAHAVKLLDRLPENEQDQEFRQWLESAHCYAEHREDALVDPS